MQQLIFIAVIVLVVLIIFVVAGFYERKRTAELKTVARSLNLKFDDSGLEALRNSLKSVHLFSVGRSRKLFNLMQGEVNGTVLSVFDYRFTTGSGRSSNTLRQTVILFDCPGLHLPGFTLRPEKVSDKIGSLFGYQDIDFEVHPQFSKSYLLRGHDEAAIRAAFNDSVLIYFDRRTGLSLEGVGQRLLCWKADARVSPNELQGFLQDGLAVFALFSKSKGPFLDSAMLNDREAGVYGRPGGVTQGSCYLHSEQGRWRAN